MSETLDRYLQPARAATNALDQAMDSQEAMRRRAGLRPTHEAFQSGNADRLDQAMRAERTLRRTRELGLAVPIVIKAPHPDVFHKLRNARHARRKAPPPPAPRGASIQGLASAVAVGLTVAGLAIWLVF